MSYKVINQVIKKIEKHLDCIEFTNEFSSRFFIHVITILVKAFIDEQRTLQGIPVFSINKFPNYKF